MSGHAFTPETLEKKLHDLSNTQQSIQTLSLWLIHYRKHHQLVVEKWFSIVKDPKLNQSKRLTLLYLANDVIQNSKKKGPEYSKEFATVLAAAFETIARDCDDKTWASMDRILKIWEERGVYDQQQIVTFKAGLGNRTVDPSLARPSSSSSKRPSFSNNNSTSSSRSQPQQAIPAKKPKVSPPVTTASIDLTSLPELPQPKEGVIIDPDQMIKALQGLETAPSKDGQIRQKIASFPPEVTDPSLVQNIRDKSQADRLQRMVEEACILLSDYNQKLSQEMESRKTIALMLATYIKNQKDSLTASERSLNEYREKLKKVIKVRSELKSHLQNLPDLRMLPSVLSSHPLPSAGDLFSSTAMDVPSGSRNKSSSLASSSSTSPSTSSPADLSDSFSTPTSGH